MRASQVEAKEALSPKKASRLQKELEARKAKKDVLRRKKALKKERALKK
jgi:hypothetical protein